MKRNATPPAALYRPRWRADASGFVGQFAGQWATAYTWRNRDALQRLLDEMPNGSQVEIVEVPAS